MLIENQIGKGGRRSDDLCFVYSSYITGSLTKWVECSPMIWETWVQSQVASYQRLLKIVLDTSLTLSNIRYVSRVKWSNLGKGVVPSPTPRCSSCWKGSLLVALDYGRQQQLFIKTFKKDGLQVAFWLKRFSLFPFSYCLFKQSKSASSQNVFREKQQNLLLYKLITT